MSFLSSVKWSTAYQFGICGRKVVLFCFADAILSLSGLQLSLISRAVLWLWLLVQSQILAHSLWWGMMGGVFVSEPLNVIKFTATSNHCLQFYQTGAPRYHHYASYKPITCRLWFRIWFVSSIVRVGTGIKASFITWGKSQTSFLFLSNLSDILHSLQLSVVGI